MYAFIARRLVGVVILLAGVNFVSFAYAHYGRYAQLENNPIFARQEEIVPVFPIYLEYINAFLKGEPPPLPTAAGLTVADLVEEASDASFGLLSIALSLSLALGLFLGMSAAKTSPPHISRWLIPLSTVSLAMPGFYVGAVLITISVAYLFLSPSTNGDLPFPLGGFGWDRHLVFPVIALAFRPTLQIAQMTASLLTEEFNKTYVTVARALGHSWRLVKVKTALRNIYVPLLQVIASSVSLMVGELILVEWLFNWPGLGRQLALSIRPPATVTIASGVLPSSYLHAPTVATVVTILGAILILSNTLAAILTYASDPRLRSQGRDGNDVNN
ncbi:MAG: ABC transporter permease [Anaerolineae bacterium]|nr:ABC transporter permease [Anaerolineae bacterium]